MTTRSPLHRELAIGLCLLLAGCVPQVTVIHDIEQQRDLYDALGIEYVEGSGHKCKTSRPIDDCVKLKMVFEDYGSGGAIKNTRMEVAEHCMDITVKCPNVLDGYMLQFQ